MKPCKYPSTQVIAGKCPYEGGRGGGERGGAGGGHLGATGGGVRGRGRAPSDAFLTKGAVLMVGDAPETVFWGTGEATGGEVKKAGKARCRPTA